MPALVNLADLDRARGTDAEGEKLLREAMTIEPDNADVNYALGLSLVRRREYAGALDLLRRAQDLAPDNARYAYFFAVALNSNGAHGEATAVLERTHRQHPADREVLTALVSIAQDTGDLAAALSHARELAALDHGDIQIRKLCWSSKSAKPTRRVLDQTDSAAHSSISAHTTRAGNRNE